ncbi:MAG TPA: glutamine amidotransferase [Stenotrophomonas sp.]|nr:glutamine amidotransferase [Stenotrophomonas sp.]
MGTLRPILESRGYRTRYHPAVPERIRALDPLDIDILILLGSMPPDPTTRPSGYCQEAIDLVRVRFHYGLPVLGIDLGAQLIACALGGHVRPLARAEIAFAPLQLTEAGQRSCLAPLGATTPVLHWHRDEIVLPPGVRSLAATPACAVQAFNHGPTTLGLQFHMEADMDDVNTRLYHLRDSLALADIDPMMLRMHASESAQRLRHACHAVMTRWLDDVDSGDGDPLSGRIQAAR